MSVVLTLTAMQLLRLDVCRSATAGVQVLSEVIVLQEVFCRTSMAACLSVRTPDGPHLLVLKLVGVNGRTSVHGQDIGNSPVVLRALLEQHGSGATSKTIGWQKPPRYLHHEKL